MLFIRPPKKWPQHHLPLEDLNTRREKLCQKLATQSAKNATLNFETNDKLYNMNTRNHDKFKITFCHTERLKKSSIPQMQRMLNRIHRET